MASTQGVRAQAFADPGNVQLQMIAAEACHEAGEIEAALKYYDAAWELGIPIHKRLEFYYGYGPALRLGGRFEDSERILRQAIKDYPYSEALVIYLCFTLHKLGRDAEALELFLHLLLEVRDLLPDVALSGDRFLDDTTLEDLRSRTGVPIIVTPATAGGLIEGAAAWVDSRSSSSSADRTSGSRRSSTASCDARQPWSTSRRA